MSVKVKICGITKIEDAHFLEEAAADFAGFDDVAEPCEDE